MTIDLDGVVGAVLAAFTDDTGHVRHDAMASNARWLYDAGLRRFLACGSVGEYHSLTPEEREHAVATVAGAVPDDATVLAGVGGALPGAIDLARAHGDNGADGFTGGVTNVAPELGLALWAALEAGEWERARELRDAAVPLMDLRTDPGADSRYRRGNSVQVVKRGLALAGRFGGPIRPPLAELADADRERVDDRYEQLRDDLDRLL